MPRRDLTFRAWMKEQFDRSELRDLARYGAAAGFHGLTYYHETTALYDEFADEIWEMLGEEADSMGEPHALALIASFRGARDVNDDSQFKNLLVWFAAEKVAQELSSE